MTSEAAQPSQLGPDGVQPNADETIGAAEFKEAFGEPIAATLDLSSWSADADLQGVYRRLAAEVQSAVEQEQRILPSCAGRCFRCSQRVPKHPKPPVCTRRNSTRSNACTEGLEVTHLLVSGVLTNYGVEHTALDAVDHGYHVTIADEATAGASEESHARWLEAATHPLLAGDGCRGSHDGTPGQRA